VSPRPPTATAEAVDALLRELGPQLRRGGLSAEPLPRFPTGLDAIDRLLGGGLPRGRLSEVSGSPTSGRTSLALSLLARTTRAGEVCAVVDVADGFDPGAADSAGVVLERVLWARAPDLQTGLRGAERVLEAEGFGLVILNRAGGGLRAAASAWTRLARTAAGTHSALVVLGLERNVGTAAEIALEMQATRAHFTGTPPLLESLETEARLLRHRSAPTTGCVRVRLRTCEAA